MSDLRYWIGFDHLKGLGPCGFSKLQNGFDSMEEAWEASAAELQEAGFGRDLSMSIVEQRKRMSLDGLMDGLAEHEVHPLPISSPGYPQQLKEVESPPNILYVKGELLERDLRGITVIGTRDCTKYGVTVCAELSSGLASRGVTVISDMVRGIDNLAQRSALRAGGRTVAVMASGLDYVASAKSGRSSNGAKLPLDIVESGSGCLVSEHPMGTRSNRARQRMRNRLLSGLAAGVLVVEAPKQSGTMFTVRCALDQGREVFAVPGRADSTKSEGTNWLISQGAKLVTEVDDIINELKDTGDGDYEVGAGTGGMEMRESGVSDRARFGYGDSRTRSQKAAIVVETAEERQIVDALLAANGGMNVDEIVRVTGLSVDNVGASLSMMEIKGYLRQVGTSYELATSGQHMIAPLMMDNA